ncbi:FAD-binding and (Fe-S)-binding domain-containing protein [Vibrio agarivorans]|uniref:FAD-binding and (Fe-S)-binding domain-containing protein n=1 Tax=Vibrio agarivorans TaxID=153622 RepID=UPI0025B4E412|nr:FAD-binding and (Fe-S)-binding domain-containing protein [Vibrio agarivorans]MDN3660872.1 FAD-binding and (Fe-S)-binding domain-containing protein [Vibrio agarivorans]
MNSAIYHKLATQLNQKLPEDRIITDPHLRMAYGTDASFYRLIPQLIVRLACLEEVIFTLQLCNEFGVAYTFRAAGTSLSGQAVSDSVLITLTDDWRHHEVIESGTQIRLQPGVIGADANKYLAPYQRKIGPDPASINTCKIGGIAANNASGMCCGTAQNSYHTIAAMKVVLHDGTFLDTSDERSITRFRQSHASMLDALCCLHHEVAHNDELKQRIEHKYRLKNTTGYALNALVDYHDPIDILAHLMIGSEGTLGFIAEVTYNTVIEYSQKASTLVVFADIETASKAVSQLANSPVAAVEMMDGRALRSVADKPGMPGFMPQLTLDASALLIEVHASDEIELASKRAQVEAILAQYSIIESVAFTQAPDVVATLWGIRKGMFPAVGAVREVGTTVIIEDVAFPVEHLAEGVRDLQNLFKKYHYNEAIIFGHALEGNLHFVFTQGFESPQEVSRYGGFMDDIAELVAGKYQGSLKAEHGTGRNMSPYVELEWGEDGYRLMQQIKQIFDPQGLLNPGVIINADQQAHLKNLKPMPQADDIVDRCIECGFCEPVCPSKGLTLTPRQRIVLYRELCERQRHNENTQELEEAFKYQGIDTCAATGLCAERCPVGINTGDLIKQLRQSQYQRYQPIARWTAKHFATTTKLVKVGLKINSMTTQLIGDKRMDTAINGLRKWTGERTPLWLKETPQANDHQLTANHLAHTAKTVVYMPSCASRNMGQQRDAQDQRSLTEVTLSLLDKAGYRVIIPEPLSDLCCGMPYDSKGMVDIAQTKSKQLERQLWQASERGKHPILMDTSPCSKRSKEHFTQPLSIYEPVGFVSRFLLSELSLSPIDESIMLHITCSARKMGLVNDMLMVANQCASNVIVPEHIECCGWAGDKGFTTPELNRNALAPLKAQVPNHVRRGFSNSRTCEIGLSHHSGVPYQSILYLIDEASIPK